MDLQSGDIFATKGSGIAVWALRNLISPPTDRFHFGTLWKRLADGDFIILESISKGLAIGKLSLYADADIHFYRVNCPADLRHQAPSGLIDWGRSKYDYLLILKLALGVARAFLRVLLTEHKVRRLQAEDFSYGVDSSLICTEAVDVAYDSVGVNLIPAGIIPIPNAFKQAEIEGRMSRLTE